MKASSHTIESIVEGNLESIFGVNFWRPIVAAIEAFFEALLEVEFKPSLEHSFEALTNHCSRPFDEVL